MQNPPTAAATPQTPQPAPAPQPATDVQGPFAVVAGPQGTQTFSLLGPKTQREIDVLQNVQRSGGVGDGLEDMLDGNNCLRSAIGLN